MKRIIQILILISISGIGMCSAQVNKQIAEKEEQLAQIKLDLIELKEKEKSTKEPIGTLYFKEFNPHLYCSSIVLNKKTIDRVSIQIQDEKITSIIATDSDKYSYVFQGNMPILELNTGVHKLWSTSTEPSIYCDKSYIKVSSILHYELDKLLIPADTFLILKRENDSITLYDVSKTASPVVTSQITIDGQVTSSTEDNDITKSELKEEVTNEYERRLKLASGNYKVGELILFKNKVKSYYGKNEKGTHEIQKVKVEIQNGTITDIQVVDKNFEVFTNGSSPIELNRLNKRKDNLRSENGDIKYITLTDILYYERNGYHIPKDTIFVLDSKSDSCNFMKSSGIQQNIDLRLYTDLLGMLGDESNGLVQTELNVNSDIHRRNIPNSPYYLVKSIDFHFAASKFDSDFRSVNIDSTFSRSTLKQQALINTELALSWFAIRNFKGNYEMDFQILGGFDLVKIRNNAALKKTISQPYWGTSWSMLVTSGPNFSAKFKLPITFQYASYFNDHNEVSSRQRTVWGPQVEFLWHPLSNPKNAVFARVEYVDINFDNNPFWKLQVGYNISISNALSK